MRIIFCGTPEFSVAPLQKLLDTQKNVVAVYTQPDRGVGRGRKVQYSAVKQCAIDNNIEVFQPVNFKDEQTIDQLQSLKPDLMVVVAYGLILPQPVLDIPTIGCWNIHASLLPRWRGAAPIHRALLANDKTTGVGIMQMEAGLDTGPVYVQHECLIAQHETAESLHDKLALMGAHALLECIELQENTLLPEPMIQDSSLVTYAHKLEKIESVISWHDSAENINRKVRALNPWPGVVAKIAEQDFKIWQTKVVSTGLKADIGAIVAANKSQLIIQCKEGQLQIEEIQKSGKKRMGIQQFMAAKTDWYR